MILISYASGAQTCFFYYEVGVKRYFAPYDTRIASHFMLSQS